ncbi:unnamed protein product [Trypanosoma congolense IL3000]|uniref:WGS project CAEQ00000000 data, annotated contig 1853 n=1 Tax=Trypanosoma congolense (strain IL3000) TaxID=1068625 RepID=F9W9E4_TRYCI|nr:unnamed protein product [Trypanosoma congolense IL3000]
MGRRMRHFAGPGAQSGQLQTGAGGNEESGAVNELAFVEHTKDNAPMLYLPVDPTAAGAHLSRNCFTYCGPDAGADPQKRLHQEFKSLSKEERQRLVGERAVETDVIARTVHLRFLPTGMLQSELAALCAECGEYLRVRICGNSTTTQNWIYGFVEFADRAGAAAMMRRSGMELPNGPGKPPLRLKCNAAKQPIVDRVFHDADPETNMRCIFGSGNFAHRTLKEAVDSYYNLKRKEGTMGATQARSTNLSHSNNASGGWSNKHKKEGQNVSNNNNVNNNNHHNYQRCDSDGVEGIAGQPLHLADGHDWMLLAASSPLSAEGCHAHTNPVMGAGSPPKHQQVPSGCGYLASPGGTSVESPSFLSSLFSHNTLNGLSAQLSRGINHETGSTDTSGCGERLSPLLGLTLPHCVTGPISTVPQYTTLWSAVERGRTLAAAAMSSCQMFIRTGEGFYDAVRAVRRLRDFTTVSIASREVFGCASAPEPIQFDEELEMLQQRMLQLQLLASLLLSLLYKVKGNCEEMLRAVRGVVTCCNAIPATRIHGTRRCLAVSSAEPAPVVVMDGNDVVGSRKDKCNYGDVSNDAGDEGKELTLTTSFDQSPVEDCADVFNPLAHVPDLFGDVNMEPDVPAGGASFSTFGASPPTSSLHAQQREVCFHSYVLNVLLTIGFSMESTQPVVARCVYVLAQRRSREFFEEVPPELEETLQKGGMHRLRAMFFANLSETAFVNDFFNNFDTDALLREQFWTTLPPEHMVRVFHAA